MGKPSNQYSIINRLKFWFIVLMFGIHIHAFSQTIPTRHFTMNDGLPDQTVRCIFKDSRGLLWIGTDAGVCTYDGKIFSPVLSFSDITPSMIWSITEDNEGNMWFGSYGEGVYKFNGESLTNYSVKDGFSDNYIRVVCNSQKNNCVVASSAHGIYTFFCDSITCNIDTSPKCQRFCLITDIIDAGDFMYVTVYGHNNPQKFYPYDNRLVNLVDINSPYSSFAAYITSKGDTVLSYEKIGVKIHIKDTIIQNMQMGQVFGIDEDKHGNLWFAAWTYHDMELFGGVFMFDGKEFHNYNSQIGITERGVWTVYCDREQDIIWVGTLNEGLFMVSNSYITNYPANYFSPNQKTLNNVFVDSENNLWVCGDEELVKMEPNGKISRLDNLPFIESYRKFWREKIDKTLPPNQTTRNHVKDLNKFSDSEILKKTKFNYHKAIENDDHSFLIANEFGIFKYDEKKDKINFITPDGIVNELETIGDTLIFSGWSITCFLSNYIKDEIIFYEEFGTDLQTYKRFTNNGQPRNVNRLVKKNDTIWYASSESGLWLSKGDKLINFNETESVICNNLSVICLDNNGDIIFGSNKDEIYIATYTNDSLKIKNRFHLKNNFKDQAIRWILTDHNHNLWVGTNRGLNCIDLKELKTNDELRIRFWDEEDGYFGQVSDRSAIDQNGTIWIASNWNLIKFETSKLLLNEPKPNELRLTQIEVNNKPINSISRISLDPWTSLPTEKYYLKHAEHDLVFHFDVINYSNPEKDLFRYILVGFDDNWSKWSGDRKAVYTNLPPGNYVFQVESYNLQTLQQSKPLMNEFKIRHPWWGLWYIQLSALILLVYTTIITTRRITINKRLRQEEKSKIDKRIVELEMYALQAQMNPHFIFNCMNNIQYYILDNKQEDALNYLADFSKVVRFSLEFATLKEISLDQEISYLTSYIRLEHMRFPDKFAYTIDITRIDDLMNIHIPPSIIQPFIENSIKHGFNQLINKGQLNIRFKIIDENTIRCSVEDNGNGRGHHGRQKDFLHRNDRVHSTSITETRIELFNSPQTPHKYRIDFIDLFEDKTPCGLKVEIFMPMERK